MTPADIERVAEIDHLSFTLPWPRTSFYFEIEKNDASRSWVAEDAAHQIVGMLVTWLIVDELHIATLATDPAYRQQRIGLRLMVHALCTAAQAGAQKSFLEVRRGNLAAQNLYSKLGYQVDGVRARYYADNHEDALLMSLQSIDSSRLKALV
jgi:ribosomal-protein-alanine N-acetyltransferase